MGPSPVASANTARDRHALSPSLLDRTLDEVWSELTEPGAPYEVEQVAVRGVPLRHYRHAPSTIRDFWAASAAFAERDYLIYGTERVSYAQAHATAGAIAHWLGHHGIEPGDRVAIAMRNYPEWLLIYWACTSIGVAVVGMNAWWVAEEMAFALHDSAPKVIFCDAERLERLRTRDDTDAGLLIVAVRATPGGAELGWDAVVARPGDLPYAEIDPDDDACIFYTSGTTGAPKGAQLTNRGCINTCMNIAFATEAYAVAEARALGVIGQ